MDETGLSPADVAAIPGLVYVTLNRLASASRNGKDGS
jgi:hypothetical protein